MTKCRIPSIHMVAHEWCHDGFMIWFSDSYLRSLVFVATKVKSKGWFVMDMIIKAEGT